MRCPNTRLKYEEFTTKKQTVDDQTPETRGSGLNDIATPGTNNIKRLNAEDARKIATEAPKKLLAKVLEQELYEINREIELNAHGGFNKLTHIVDGKKHVLFDACTKLLSDDPQSWCT